MCPVGLLTSQCDDDSSLSRNSNISPNTSAFTNQHRLNFIPGRDDLSVCLTLCLSVTLIICVRARRHTVSQQLIVSSQCIQCVREKVCNDSKKVKSPVFYRAAWNAVAVQRWEFCLSVRPSVCPSVCLSNACIVTKRKKAVLRFLYHMKEHLSQFSEQENGWWGMTPST